MRVHPGARIDAAIEVFRQQAMQAVSDAALPAVDPSISMGAMILQMRQLLSLSLQEVADRAGITKSHMWEMEQGRAVNPTISTVHGIATALGISFTTLAAAALNDVRARAAAQTAQERGGRE